jgi:hypothetical protein
MSGSLDGAENSGGEGVNPTMPPLTSSQFMDERADAAHALAFLASSTPMKSIFVPPFSSQVSASVASESKSLSIPPLTSVSSEPASFLFNHTHSSAPMTCRSFFQEQKADRMRSAGAEYPSHINAQASERKLPPFALNTAANLQAFSKLQVWS